MRACRPGDRLETKSVPSEKNPRKLEFFVGPCETEPLARNWSPDGDSAVAENARYPNESENRDRTKKSSGIRETEKEHREGTRRRRRRRRGGDGRKKNNDINV